MRRSGALSSVGPRAQVPVVGFVRTLVSATIGAVILLAWRMLVKR